MGIDQTLGERGADVGRVYVAPDRDKWRDVLNNANPISGSVYRLQGYKEFSPWIIRRETSQGC